MSLFELLYVGHAVGSNRRGLRLPLLLGRLHLGLIFSGPCSSSSGRKANAENYCSLRSFLFIATVLITKCGSSTFPNNRNTNKTTTGFLESTASAGENLMSSVTTQASTLTTTEDMFFYLIGKHLKEPTVTTIDTDHQDYPMQHLMSMQAKEKGHYVNGQYIGHHETLDKANITVAYVLKGMIMPLIMVLTLSFGFVIYKNRVKRARLQAIQSALEAARMNPNQLVYPPVGSGTTWVSILEPRRVGGEWTMISGGDPSDRLLQGELDDYIGEGGETARHKPYFADRPPDYASVVDPPTYEAAMGQSVLKSPDKPDLKKKQSDPVMVVPTVSVIDTSVATSSFGGRRGEGEHEQLLSSRDLGDGELGEVEQELERLGLRGIVEWLLGRSSEPPEGLM